MLPVWFLSSLSLSSSLETSSSTFLDVIFVSSSSPNASFIWRIISFQTGCDVETETGSTLIIRIHLTTSRGGVISSIFGCINTCISAVAHAVMAIISAIGRVILAIFNSEYIEVNETFTNDISYPLRNNVR